MVVIGVWRRSTRIYVAFITYSSSNFDIKNITCSFFLKVFFHITKLVIGLLISFIMAYSHSKGQKPVQIWTIFPHRVLRKDQRVLVEPSKLEESFFDGLFHRSVFVH